MAERQLKETADSTRSAAWERLVRTFWQGIGFDITAAVAYFLYGLLTAEDSNWANFWPMLVKTVALAVVSYVMRLKVKPSAERAVATTNKA